MIKWIVTILLIAGIFASPVTQGGNTHYNVSDKTIQSTMMAAKKTIRNVLVVTNNVVEVLILNLDSTTVNPVQRKDFNTKTY